MHDLLHLAILTSVLLGAAGLGILLLWPLMAEAPLPPVTKRALLALAALGAVLLVVEWRFVH